MKIVSASENGIPSILDINRSVNVTGVTSETNGFLIYRWEAPTLAPLIEKGQVLIAQSEEGTTEGYLVFQYWEDSRMAETRDEMKTVRSPAIDLFALERLIWITQLGVRFSAGRRGVGSALYRELFKRFPGYSFAATVAEIPHNNEASAALHRKLGFSRIGSFETDDFHGVKNYRSGVYCKK